MICEKCSRKNGFAAVDVHNFIESLIRTVEAKDVYTSGHSERVAEVSMELSRLAGLSSGEIETIHFAAHLHDIGKIGIPDGILLKNAKLSPAEFEVIKDHPVIGHRILQNVNGFGEIADLVLHHHEHYNGEGYPSRLKGSDIPLGARIIQIADTCDAMTSFRSYRKNLSINDVLLEFDRCSGSQFDPELTRLFSAYIEKKHQSAERVSSLI